MRPQTILVVDDSSSIRSILKVYLMGLKAEVLDAESGERALQLARLLPLSLMIVDINMPGMDGLTLVDKVRHDSRAAVAKLPVILLTSDRSEASRARMREVGANDLLYKPVTAETLLAAAGRLLRLEKAAGT
ncbi:MAG TPA: response regulator [Myxococcales bacterium]|nr:response regulator [Myxococcales bacterium]